MPFKAKNIDRPPDLIPKFIYRVVCNYLLLRFCAVFRRRWRFLRVPCPFFPRTSCYPFGFRILSADFAFLVQSGIILCMRVAGFRLRNIIHLAAQTTTIRSEATMMCCFSSQVLCSKELAKVLITWAFKTGLIELKSPKLTQKLPK